MSRVFRIVEARCVDTNTLEKRKVYTSDSHYIRHGHKSVDRLRLFYNVTVITYTACKEETVEHLKQNKRNIKCIIKKKI